jgi:hypothetical protein
VIVTEWLLFHPKSWDELHRMLRYLNSQFPCYAQAVNGRGPLQRKITLGANPQSRLVAFHGARYIVARAKLRALRTPASVDLLPDLIGRARHKAWLMLIAKQRANNRAFVAADRRVRRSLKKPGAGA